MTNIICQDDTSIISVGLGAGLTISGGQLILDPATLEAAIAAAFDDISNGSILVKNNDTIAGFQPTNGQIIVGDTTNVAKSVEVTAGSVAVGNATNGLAGVAISDGQLAVGDTTNGVKSVSVPYGQTIWGDSDSKVTVTTLNDFTESKVLSRTTESVAGDSTVDWAPSV